MSTIRRCRPDDAPRIAEIYNQAILGSPLAAPDAEPVTVESRVEWIARHQDPYPAYAWESRTDGVMAFAGLGPFSVRPDWRWMAELSLYVDPRAHHGVIGSTLGLYVKDQAKRLGFRIAVARILTKNTPMLRSAHLFGFRPAAELPEACYQRGSWQTVTLMVRVLE